MDLATELGIVVANSPGNTITVGESTILLMLALGKGMLGWIEAARTGTEPTWRAAVTGASCIRRCRRLPGTSPAPAGRAPCSSA